MKHKQDYFVGGKNHRIFYQAWINKEPNAIIQIIHGGVEHTGRYKHLVKYLTDNGFAVYGNDHRGHGKSEGRRNHIKSLDDYVVDCFSLTQIIEKNHKDVPIVVIGHSVGSLVAQRYAIKHQEEITGLVLSGSGARIPPLHPALHILARLMNKILPTFKGPAGIIPEEISSDPESVQDYVTDPLINYKQASASYGLNLINHYKDVKDKISSIKIPVLIQKGELDTMMVDLDELIDDLENSDVTVKMYKDSKHEVYTETKEKRDKAFSDLVEWLKLLL